jgi:two-component system NarL family response regulator
MMDLSMPDMDGADAIKAIRKDFPSARFVVLTVYVSEMDIFRAFEAGAQGYLLKKASVEEILNTIRAVHRGERRIPQYILAKLDSRNTMQALTERELEVLNYLAKGRSNDEIAVLLSITVRTVKAHVHA